MNRSSVFVVFPQPRRSRLIPSLSDYVIVIYLRHKGLEMYITQYFIIIFFFLPQRYQNNDNDFTYPWEFVSRVPIISLKRVDYTAAKQPATDVIG